MKIQVKLLLALIIMDFYSFTIEYYLAVDLSYMSHLLERPSSKTQAIKNIGMDEEKGSLVH